MPHDIQEISNFRLKTGLWLVRHKILFLRACIGFLCALIALLYGFTLWKGAEIFIFEKAQKEKIAASLIENSIDFYSARAKLEPEDLQVSSLKTLGSAGERAHIIARVYNPNEKYAAKRITYQFLSGEKVLSEDVSYVWPGENKYIGAFGIPAKDIPSGDVSLAITATSWEFFQDFDAVLSERMNFEISQLRYEPSGGGNAFSGAVKFTVTNDTIYNYYDPGFYIIFFNGDDVVGAYFTRLDMLRSLESRSLGVNIADSPGIFTEFSVFTELNILDESVYFTGRGPDARDSGTLRSEDVPAE